jgi:LacI family transcriptional regulator, gluconate utilization system Gnt-I transcriptional repressor
LKGEPVSDRSGSRTRGAGQHPRMEDIARMAGVAPMTVSRALQTPEKVAKETRARIQAVIEKLGYVPNFAARSLASNKSPFVVVIVPTITTPIYSDSYEGISEVLLRQGYHILLGNNGYSPEREEALLSAFMAYRPAGVILTGYTHTPGLRRLITRAKLPVVETFNITDRPLKVCVGYSNYQAMADVAEYVVGKGRRSPVFLAARSPLHDRHLDRKSGFEAVRKKHGLKNEPSMVVSDLRFEAAAKAIGEHLDRHPETDAILAGSDILALGALAECRRRGLAVPERMAIVGFDDQEIASIVEPRLTTVRVPRTEIGRRAAEMLLAQIRGAKVPKRVIDELVRGGTG